MRRILVDHARAKATDKRGRGLQRVCLSLAEVTATNDPVNLIVINDLLEKLETLNARHAKIVECRIFGGLTLEEIAETLSVSLATVKNDWRFCKAWLSSQMAN
jgi:RNA polymerase sigma factor (TIGR02999 family)